MEYMVIPVRLQAHEAQHLRQMARAHNLKNSTYIRYLINAAKPPKVKRNATTPPAHQGKK